MGNDVPPRGRPISAKTAAALRRPAPASGMHWKLDVMIATAFDLWSTEQLLLVYQRYYGKLDTQTRRRILEAARLNGWDRSWRDGVELLAA